MNKPRYRTYASYLKERFGHPVRKLSLDAGFTCPNRDGAFSDAGCIFCEPASFSPFSRMKEKPIIHQIRSAIDAGHQRGVHHFIAYFQAYTNTYGPLDRLHDVYSSIRAFPEIIGLSVGTRPDCVDKEKLRLIHSFATEYDVWLDYGLQSIHDKTLDRINRGHTANAFFQAVRLTRQFDGIKICAHVILGLPEESEIEEQQTARAIARLKLEGVKLHPLHVVGGTTLEKMHAAGTYTPLTMDNYVERVVLFLEELWPQTVIQRLTADSLDDTLVAPDWLKEKQKVLQAIQNRLETRDTWQGKQYQDL